ncbi:UIM domain and EF hand containing protein that also has a conserved domain between [Cryptosporidium ryanae]|uniref:UIM domain and EF hand containing protein that also has a conserved domain between n=1 Tax=Cryptosporidium ryanae TaxID=515981 RepID=UPI003519E895|nr:UIM domain and EF hand containing protein that also has a conserved domain between [Cryptosporidium ryanae]
MNGRYFPKNELDDYENLDLQRALVDSLKDYNAGINSNINNDTSSEKTVESELMSSPKINDLLDYLNSKKNEFMNIILHGSNKSSEDIQYIKNIIWNDNISSISNGKKHYFVNNICFKNKYNCENDLELRMLPYANSARLIETVFGRGGNLLSQKEDIHRWVNHTLKFKFGQCLKVSSSNDNGFSGLLLIDNYITNMNNCLIQQGGGPCGILSSLNGLIIMQLIFNQKRIKNETNLVHYLNNISEQNCFESLIESICIILFQSAHNSKYRIIQFNNVDINSLEFQLYYVEYDNIMDVYNYYSKRLCENIFNTKGSLFSLLLTIIESRTIDKVKDDMDDQSNPLIGLYGQCNQELVNLCLTGNSVSNVFDGIKTLDGSSDSFVLKGIQKKSIIGYLTEHEALGYCSVGLNYKYPLFPIWIICNKNHYKCCFTFNYTECILSPYQELTQKMEKSFQKYDSDNSGFILEHQIQPYLIDVNMQEYLYEINKISENGIVLWNDLREYILNSKRIYKDNNYGKFRLWTTVYLFDGQTENSIKIIKSTIFNLENFDIVKGVYNKYSNSVTNINHNSNSAKIAEEIDIISILQTRWSRDTIIETELSIIKL